MQLIPNLLIIPTGVVIGVLVAAPVGPVNVLCIQRAIERGFWGGMAAGLGAVLGDGLIALFASLGVTAISGAIEAHRTAIQAIGGLAITALGINLYFSPPRLNDLLAGSQRAASLKDYAWDIPQTFFLTITNPGAVLGLVGIFGLVTSFVEIRTKVDALTMVASIMGGSLAWWIGLSRLIGRVRHKLNPARLSAMNRIAGVLLICFGALLLCDLIWSGAR
ncbi:MAG: LysE family transporter [Hyphomicrobium sp.]|jgi:threonine/homoserine/homoserine lactone efflux protein